jgi:hypothetical protein
MITKPNKPNLKDYPNGEAWLAAMKNWLDTIKKKPKKVSTELID